MTFKFTVLYNNIHRKKNVADFFLDARVYAKHKINLTWLIHDNCGSLSADAGELVRLGVGQVIRTTLKNVFLFS